MPHVFHAADEPERHFDAPNPVWTAADFPPADVEAARAAMAAAKQAERARQSAEQTLLRETIARLQNEEEARLIEQADARRAAHRQRAEADRQAEEDFRTLRRGTDQPALARQEAAEYAALLAEVAVARERARSLESERDAQAERASIADEQREALLAEASEGVRTLAAALVSQGSALRDAHALAERQAAALKRAEAGQDANEVAAGELAARRWLDALVEYGLPSTTYERADADFRRHVTRILRYTAEHANRLLGDFHAIPDAAWERRDTTWPHGPQQPDEVDLADLAAMWGHHDDDEATEREDEEDDE